MNFNIIKFLRDYGIPYVTEGENTAPGWININCPFCIKTDTLHHLGFNLKNNYWVCWRCGHHWPEKVIQQLTNCSFVESKRLFREYSGNLLIYEEEEEKSRNRKTSIKLPGRSLKEQHKKYLRKRKFDPDYLEKKYHLRGTNNYENYKFRIIAPIYFNKKLVSYQGRDYTNRQELRYKACRIENELVHHKHILYNIDNCKLDKVVVVEGITDVWRLGDNSCCTFGTSYTKEQINLISDRFKQVAIFFDREKEAELQAEGLAMILDSIGIETQIYIPIYEDPASITQEDADNFMKEVVG